MQYHPPSPEDLARPKDDLGLNIAQMARLFGLSGGRHWRKYTAGSEPQGISPLPLFFPAAHLELDGATHERVLQRMCRVAATRGQSAESVVTPSL